MKVSIRFGGAAVALAISTAAIAAELPMADPAEVGMSSEKLARVDAFLEDKIAVKDFPGAVLLVARDGKIAHLAALGKRSPNGEEMTVDSIFRIYSMTKPITSVVALMLVEEGKLDLAAPVSRYLPEFAEMTVATGTASDGSVQVEPATRPITVLDLMRHTAGLTYGFFGKGPARAALKAENPGNGEKTNREVARVIGGLPLEHQPGTAWEYSRATDVLGAVIEVIDGRKLSEVMQTRVFDPLGMVHTGFSVKDQASRALIAEPYDDDRMIGNIPVFDPRETRPFETGGGGLVSTAQDYALFMQMLMSGGTLDGKRLLSPATVRYMLTDQLGDIAKGKYDIPGKQYGFGLGVAVRRDAGGSALMGNPGDFFWGGSAGTYMMGDPTEDMFVVWMLQAPKKSATIRGTLRNMIYGSIDELEAPAR